MRENPAYRKALVFVQGQNAGVLSETDVGYAFAYSAAYLSRSDAVSVSLTLPLQAEAFESRTLFSFFDGLIPEGWLLNVVSRNWKIPRNDRFGLLLAACRDSVGDVSVVPVEEIVAEEGQ